MSNSEGKPASDVFFQECVQETIDLKEMKGTSMGETMKGCGICCDCVV
jgi:hypothetical protein